MQTEFFANRIAKRYKHLRKWAKRTGVSCYRLYDGDIPEIPLAVDIYEDTYLRVFLYERPYEKPEDEELLWLESMLSAASLTLSIPRNHIFSKMRKRQRGDAQYEKEDTSGFFYTVTECGLQFIVNLSDYIDTGLFFDHRPTRSLVRSESKGKRVLNLFCYTGSFSVYAASGGAAEITSVDLSKTYLEWAEKNMALNGFAAANSTVHSNTDSPSPYQFIRSDVSEFLQSAKTKISINKMKKWDIIILDPPTFSNSKKTENDLDINRDWQSLVNNCIDILADEGTLYFSTNSCRLRFSTDAVLEAHPSMHMHISDISEQTIPEDFRNQKIHRCWKITIKI